MPDSTQDYWNTTASKSGDADAVASIVRNASTSFYGAMRMLPNTKRDAIYAVYAFCRIVDDIADDDAIAPADRRSQLNDWRDEIDLVFGGFPNQTIGRALAVAVAEFGLQHEDFLAVIDGMEMDIEEPIRRPDREVFELYCDRAACAVGRLCVLIFGIPGQQGRDLANAQGRALQITNILRDVQEDAGRGRLYIPSDILDSVGITSDDPEKVITDPAYTAAWRALAGEALTWFERAKAVMALCDKKSVRPSRIMLEVYRRNFDRMTGLTDAQIRDPAVSKRLVGKTEKILITLRHGLF